MTQKEFDKALASLAELSGNQRTLTAAIYGDLLASFAPVAAKIQSAIDTLGATTSVPGMTELGQAMRIMDGGFARIAKGVIAEATAAAQQDAAPQDVVVETPNA